MTVAVAATEKIEAGVLAEISQALHDMCQPLTVLHCRLEMGRLLGTEDSHRDAVNHALADWNRLMHAVESMRTTLRRAAGETQDSEVGSR